MWLEAHIEFPKAGVDGQHASVPPNFAQMAIDGPNGVPRIRVRLTALLPSGGEIEEKLEYILQVDEDGEPTSWAGSDCAACAHRHRRALRRAQVRRAQIRRTSHVD